MLFLFQGLFLCHLPQSSHPHWRGFWFCFQSLQENDNCFSRKPRLAESRFPQWRNDAGSYRSAGLVLCQQRGVLSLYFRIPSLISALCPGTTKKCFPGSILLTVTSFDAQMESWTLVPQGAPWSLLGLGSFLWFDETRMLQEALMWMWVRDSCSASEVFYIFRIITQKYSCFFFYSGYFRRCLGLCSPNALGLLLEMSLPSPGDRGLVADNSVSDIEKSLKVSYHFV